MNPARTAFCALVLIGGIGASFVLLPRALHTLRALGIKLRSGEVVTTGTCCRPLPIQPGDVFAADFGVLGKVSVRFS